MDKTGLRFTLQVDGLPENTFVVAGFTLHEQYSALFRLELELASASPALEFAKVLDSSVTLTIWREGEIDRTVNGIATSMEQGDTGFHQTRYKLSVRPALWRTGLKTSSRIFQHQDVRDILETLLQPWGLSHFAWCFHAKREPREFCVQYQETDLAFLERLCAEEGIFYFFEHDGDTHTLVFADDRVVLNKGPELSYNPSLNAQLQEQCVHTLRRRESIRASHLLAKDYTFKNPRWAAEYQRDATDAHDMEHQQREYATYDYPGRYKDDRPGKNVARWRLDGLRNDAHEGEGASNCATLMPGCEFTLTDHPRDEMNTCWQISAITHTGRQPQALEAEAGERGTTLSNTFRFIPHSQTWRPRILRKPKIDGAQIAIVTGPEGEEIYCDEYGRVRVRFIWDKSGLTDDRSSCWIRVSQPWAGQSWGGLAIPRVGHEVIVEFLNGDPDQPVIIGRTYHAANMPPGKLPATKTRTSLRTHTYKGDGFNELSFEDAAGRQEVFIHAQKDMNTRVLHDRSTQVDNDHRETVDGHQTITIKKNQRIDVHQNETETVGQNQTLTVKQNQSETVLLNKAESIGIVKALSIGSTYQTTVGMMMNTSVGLSQRSQIGLSKSLLVGKSYDTSVGETVTFSVGKQKTETVGNVSIHNVGEHFELVCGKARIVLTKDGGIFLKGEFIELQASSALNGDADLIQLNCGATKAPPDAPKRS